jgi:hypothetical protein
MGVDMNVDACANGGYIQLWCNVHRYSTTILSMFLL